MKCALALITQHFVRPMIIGIYELSTDLSKNLRTIGSYGLTLIGSRIQCGIFFDIPIERVEHP